MESTSAAAASQRLRVKGGAVVDPASGLEDRASVARDAHGRPLSAVLGMVDLVRGSNSYYKYLDCSPVNFCSTLISTNPTLS